ncbi:hypothetical protein [Shouchella lehensis]|uniref:Uncharacterized protein n=1 Tax=Shouchella lehensis G1 TaxID=1246626 RepID=A0A060LYX3_9BACI|nr:hypothetical protein [Shouchella lehensis]AIC95392.1 hypothetical protein BleG1_2828 [Shouchella lehensis G1]
MMRVTIVLKSGYNMNGHVVNDNFKGLLHGWKNNEYIELSSDGQINAIILSSEIASMYRQAEGA